MNKPAILIVCDDNEVYWHTDLRDYLTPFGEVVFSDEQRIPDLIGEPFRLVIVDTENIENMPGLVRSLRLADEEAHIVVLSAVPTWKAARAAFESGADDFYRKRFDPQAMMEYLKPYLTASGPRKKSQWKKDPP